MKKIIFIISLFFLTIGCEKKQLKIQEIESLKSENNKLRSEVILLTNKLKQYREFEKNFKNEYKINPDSTISQYNKIISDNSNTVLKEIILIRIKEVNENKLYWNKEDGWKISKDGILLKPKFGIEKKSCK